MFHSDAAKMKPSLYVFGLLVCCAGGVLQERQRSKAETDVINGLPAFTDVDDLMAKLRVQHPNYNRHRGNSIKELSSKNLCYCTDEGACDRKDTCFKEADAACFHAQEQVLNREKGRMETWHIYGCAPKERGSNGSHLTCNGYRSHHSRPFTIGCCYEGNYCNRHVVPSPYANGVYAFGGHESGQLRSNYAWVVEILIVGMVFATLSTFAILSYRKFYLPNTKKGCGSDLPTLDFLDLEAIEKESLLFDMSSGLGCGQAVLNRRNVAMQLELGEVVGRGRYGEVRKAAYRGRTVAVKTFYTTEEDSWRNERAIYETNMLNHDNILQFVAADISSVDSMTQMLLITDFCEYGSLYDYLRSGVKITLEEAIKLAYTSICGVEHLHCPVIGTENRNKPEIAHRDIKTKNVIVKRPGVCCIADFGLAVQYKDELTPKNVKVRVGTKRYMSPEVLTDTLNVANFDNFKLSDIYAFSLLLWEILVHLSPESDSHSVANTTSSGLNSLEKQNSFKKEKNKPVQYYHVNEIDHKNANLQCYQARG
ncbi:hypothetical protein L596_005186 [Steinernema carpocapsae]|uniref:receptor protein serine/threonine kinase n=1 Tax=Steinernema carpocapsae TaxID=34508 RepID=A0A4U8UY74_STECR|nr:hypothetical protein L596_005186 [Steinernema carpocapsae]